MHVICSAHQTVPDFIVLRIYGKGSTIYKASRYATFLWQVLLSSCEVQIFSSASSSSGGLHVLIESFVLSLQQRTDFRHTASLLGLDSLVSLSLTTCRSAVSTTYHLIAAAICTSFNFFREMYSIIEFWKHVTSFLRTCTVVSLCVFTMTDLDGSETFSSLNEFQLIPEGSNISYYTER